MLRRHHHSKLFTYQADQRCIRRERKEKRGTWPCVHMTADSADSNSHRIQYAHLKLTSKAIEMRQKEKRRQGNLLLDIPDSITYLPFYSYSQHYCFSVGGVEHFLVWPRQKKKYQKKTRGSYTTQNNRISRFKRHATFATWKTSFRVGQQ